MATLTEITSEPSFEETTSSLSPSTLLLLYFHTPWAAPCAQMRTILTTLAPSYSPSNTSFLSINAEDLPDVSERYDVSAVPFLVLIKDGKVLETVSGSDATKVREAIERHASGKSDAGAGAGAKKSELLPPPQKADASNGPAKNLSSYAPEPTDPGTAPEMTGSGTTPAEELHARLTELVKAASVMLFMKGTPSGPQCGFSRQLVGLLREKGVRYGFFNILADEEVRQGLKEFADWPTFPQLWVGGELVGGLDIVKEELANDPDFLKDYAINKVNGGGPGSAEATTQATTAAA
ncbi:MAG: monothiol glutaredoxin grx4 [Sclerophora amabilis]|nr:MAG: monothiol glutaredoxin grx4 [Sclerophora amabilis]